MQTIVTNYLNTSYGLTTSLITTKFPQAILIGRNNPQDVLAFNNNQLLSAITDTGKRTVIIAGFPAEFGLLYNCLIAKQQGFNVWAVIDASPAYDPLAASVALS